MRETHHHFTKSDCCEGSTKDSIPGRALTLHGELTKHNRRKFRSQTSDNIWTDEKQRWEESERREE